MIAISSYRAAKLDATALTKWEVVAFDDNGKPLTKVVLSTRRTESTYYLKRVSTHLLKATQNAVLVHVRYTEYAVSDSKRRVVSSEVVYQRTRIGGKVSKWY